MSRIYLEVVSDLKSVVRSPFWVSKPDFLTCESGNTEEPTILETYVDLYFDCVDLYILGFGLIFWVLNSYLGVWTCILGV